jgi:hypothetical protein
MDPNSGGDRESFHTTRVTTSDHQSPWTDAGRLLERWIVLAVIASPFRDPPSWARAEDSGTAIASRPFATTLRSVLDDAEFFTRYAPLRVSGRLWGSR